jgi:hypothetical protein
MIIGLAIALAIWMRPWFWQRLLDLFGRG